MSAGRRSTANGNLGSKWIRPEKRLAVYLRDGFECVYCGKNGKPATILNTRGGALLTLDHLQPRELGGDNDPFNLVTACVTCNSARKALGVSDFIRVVAQAGGYSEEEIRRRVRNAQRRSWVRHMPEAKLLDAEPPGWLKSLRFLASRDMRDRMQAEEEADHEADEIPF